MAKTVLSSGIRGIDWQECISLFSQVSNSIVHNDKVMLGTDGRFDELLIQADISDSQLKSARRQFRQYLAKITPNKKSLINFYSDPAFIESSNAWHEINSNNTFLFFFCSPEYFLAKAKAKSKFKDEKTNKQEVIDNWLEDATNIWDFYTQFPENTCVINIEDAESDIANSVKSIATSLNIKNINISNKKNVKRIMNFEHLAFLLSQNLSLTEFKDNYELQDLFDNLLMVSAMADNNIHHNKHERATQLLQKCYHLSVHLINNGLAIESELVKQTSNSLKLEKKITDLQSHNSKFKTALDERTKQRDEQANKYQDNNKTVVELTNQNENFLVDTEKYSATISELESCNLKLENKTTALVGENELSLLQINQLQEELERTSIQSNELATQNENLLASTEKKSLTISELESSHLKLANTTSELTSENELSLLQISQLQEELESIYIQSNQQLALSSKLETKISDLQNKNLQFNTLLDEQAKQIDEQTSKYQENKKIIVELKKQNDKLLAHSEKQVVKISELERNNIKLDNNASEVTKENELSPLQINQLQEEFEATYIQYSQQVTLNLKFEAKITELDSNRTQLENIIEERATENELCLLQINQLQEELEYHYAQYKKATYSSAVQNNYQVDLGRLKSSLTLMRLS